MSGLVVHSKWLIDKPSLAWRVTMNLGIATARVVATTVKTCVSNRIRDPGRACCNS